MNPNSAVRKRRIPRTGVLLREPVSTMPHCPKGNRFFSAIWNVAGKTWYNRNISCSIMFSTTFHVTVYRGNLDYFSDCAALPLLTCFAVLLSDAFPHLLPPVPSSFTYFCRNTPNKQQIFCKYCKTPFCLRSMVSLHTWRNYAQCPTLLYSATCPVFPPLCYIIIPVVLYCVYILLG